MNITPERRDRGVESPFNVLEQRIARLEHQNTRYAAIAATFALALVVAFYVGAKRDETTIDLVQAKEFRLVGEEGQIHATMRVADDGTAAFAFLRKDRKPALIVGLDQNGRSAISLSDIDGNQVILGTAEAGPGLIVRNLQSKSSVAVGLIEGDGAVFATGDKGDAVLRAMKKGPIFAVTDSEGKSRAMVGMNNGRPVIAQMDENEKPTWRATP